jgi:hypothetical protein
MKLAEAIGTKLPKTICAIDASTNSLAFAIFNTQEKTLESVGKINFKGKDTYEKVMDAGQKVKLFVGVFSLRKGYGCRSKG